MVRAGSQTDRRPCTSPATAFSLRRSEAANLRKMRRGALLRSTAANCYCRWPSRTAVAALALLSVQSRVDIAEAASCTISGSSVTLGAGACTIAVNTTLNGSPAVHATTSAQITTNNVTINPFNGGSIGGLAETSGTIIFSSGSSINGNWSTAASAQTGGQIIFQPGSVINPAFGGGGIALLADGINGLTGAPSRIDATGLTVNLNGAGGNVAAKAADGATINLRGDNAITFSPGGGGNTGLWAIGSGSQIISNGTVLTMPGGGGADSGVKADAGATIRLNGDTVTVHGNGGGEAGLVAGVNSSITGTGVTLDVSSGGGDRGGHLHDGGTIMLTGGSVTTSGPGDYGFLFQAPTNVTNSLGLDGTVVNSAADAFAVRGGGADITTTGATVSSNNGVLLSVAQTSAVTMTSDHSTLTGAITTDSTSTSNVTLGGGTIWNMTGNSNATNLTNNASSILVSAPTGDPTQLASYKTLTVMNYTGSGGNIALNTYLGNDNSPSDRLIINAGTATRRDNPDDLQHNWPGGSNNCQRHCGSKCDQRRHHSIKRFRTSAGRITGRRLRLSAVPRRNWRQRP